VIFKHTPNNHEKIQQTTKYYLKHKKLKNKANNQPSMKNKIKRRGTQASFISICCVCIYISTLSPNLLGGIAMGTFFTALLLGTLYKYYRNSRANQKEKHQMDSQIQTEGHYYKIWYTPADSTELQYQKEKMQEKIRKKRR